MQKKFFLVIFILIFSLPVNIFCQHVTVKKTLFMKILSFICPCFCKNINKKKIKFVKKEKKLVTANSIIKYRINSVIRYRITNRVKRSNSVDCYINDPSGLKKIDSGKKFSLKNLKRRKSIDGNFYKKDEAILEYNFEVKNGLEFKSI